MEQEERIFELNTKQDFLVGVCGVVIVRETLFFIFHGFADITQNTVGPPRPIRNANKRQKT